MIRSLRKVLEEPALRGVSVDSSDHTRIHRQVLLRKPELRGLFADFYRQCRQLDEHYFQDVSGARLEIGSGSSLLSRFYPDVVSSDLKVLPQVDLVTSADRLPLPDATLRAVYAINVFHHLPDVRRFFREVLRTLRPGGGVVLIEPYFGALARWLFPRLHESEKFDVDMSGWSYAEHGGPMSTANQALAYIVFNRDRQVFEEEFPALDIVHQEPHTHARYLCSGGVNFRSLLPGRCAALARWFEKLARPLLPIVALQQTLVLRKRHPHR